GPRQFDVDLDAVGFAIVARKIALWQDTEAGLVEVAADIITTGLELLGHLGEVDGRARVGTGRGDRDGRCLLALPEHLPLADELDAKIVEPLVVLLEVLLANDRVAECLGVAVVGILDPEAITLEVGQLRPLLAGVNTIEFDDEDPAPGRPTPANFLVERRQLA